MNWLSGKKTYILAIVALLDVGVYALKSLGLPAFQGIPDGALQAVAGFVGAGSLVTLRSAIDKLNPPEK